MYRKKQLSVLLVLSMILMLLVGCGGIDESSNLQETTGVQVDQEVIMLDGEGLEAHFIDVGQGNATFIVGPEGQTMLHDAGGDGDVGRIVVDYIKGLGHEKIDVAVFTHPHADHINGAPTVFRELEVGAVYYPKVTHTTRTFENFVEAVEKAGLKFKTAKAGVKIPFGNVDAVLVAPISDTYDNLNDYSAVVKVTWGNTSLLLTGDVENASEEEMVASDENLNVDVLLIPHHGSNSSSTQAFLDKTNPRYGIISSGRDNKYGHPHREVVERLRENNIAFYNTAETGTIVVILDGEEVGIYLAEGTQIGGTLTEKKMEVNEEKAVDEETEEAIGKSMENVIEDLDVEAFINDPTPSQNARVTVTVQVTSKGHPVPNAEVKLLNHFKSTTTPYEGVTDEEGIVEISYSIGRASIGYEVKVEATAKKGDIEAATTTSFTPQ
ncbi:hydrolase of metallo-beta-lactamase superfamily [Clostridium aceticum]|uniref:Hydrolase of metallo-beta-lactamase superfamily n=1 Tax=Clostridium aceticum TaxID=84022 RepID=A0A0G3W7G3_9CLOT|nr:ComEC/Rec2 family competence protein [Clostridium aceticum]AKL94601.1 hydrolase of metallo-beta-lactamase superfamily [Clostridium aceticum]